MSSVKRSIYHRLFKTVIILLFINSVGCSGRFVPIKVPCGPDPTLKEIHVKNGQIPKEQTPDVIDNNLSLWKRIHELKKIGCVD